MPEQREFVFNQFQKLCSTFSWNKNSIGSAIVPFLHGTGIQRTFWKYKCRDNIVTKKKENWKERDRKGEQYKQNND